MPIGEVLDAAPISAFHRKAVVVSGVGFFTDAYDLFVISTVATLVAAQWHLSGAETSWVSGSAILGAFVGAIAFGRLADLLGRKKVYATVAAVMVLGALASAFSAGFGMLVAGRFVLGLGIGGDYPVSAVLMSEYSNRNDRGRLVGLVFSMQALGLIVGPIVALGLIESGIGGDLTWRLLLGLGAVPVAAVVYMRSKMPESPRYEAGVRGRASLAAAQLAEFSKGALPALDTYGLESLETSRVVTSRAGSAWVEAARTGAVGTGAVGTGAVGTGAGTARDCAAVGAGNASPRAGVAEQTPSGTRASAANSSKATGGGLGQLLRDKRLLRLLVGTAGSWFVFDYAYYGNTLSLPVILKGVDPSAHVTAKLAWSLGMFVVFALPGYLLAVWKMDRIGHRRLQFVGFAVLAAAFLVLALVPALTSNVAAFLGVFGLTYFFVEFGPNTTTFVLPSEVFPVGSRATGHGISAGIGKLGAFLGVFLVPALEDRFGLRSMLAMAAIFAVVGIALTRLLPEPARRGLEEVSGDGEILSPLWGEGVAEGWSDDSRLASAV